MSDIIIQDPFFGKGSLKNAFAVTLFKRLLPLFIAAGVLAGVGWWAHMAVADSIRKELGANLNAILSNNVATLESWMAQQSRAAETIAADPQFRGFAHELITVYHAKGTTSDHRISPLQLDRMRNGIASMVRTRGFHDFLVIEPGGRIVGAMEDDYLGRPASPDLSGYTARAFSGRTVISLPFHDALPYRDEKGILTTDRLAIFAVSPVREKKNGGIVAVLALRINPFKDFTRILEIARFGRSGESYAFDGRGVMISETRFSKQLIRIGLLPDQPGVRAMLNVALRDPGGNLLEGVTSTAQRFNQPLTVMAASAVSGNDGLDVEGYRDYRGVPVIGAWRWLAGPGFGVAVELEVVEGYRSLNIVKKAFWGIFALLGLVILLIIVYSVYMLALEGRMKTAIRDVRKLGQYTLEEKVGGTLGEVYRASHTFMRRPTMVKLVHTEQHSNEEIQRFQREVRLTSRLTHPNTVRIYDYGFTAEGTFYYAMEYLKGANLVDVIRKCGPIGEARVIHILVQACGALAEAHQLGLVHRDIKPENLMLCERGGIFDFLKVLDFGLVKDVKTLKQEAITNPKFAVGTPRYLPPEAIQASDQMDARSDLFSLGAVGYYMLTACELFETDNVLDIIHMHLCEDPQLPSKRAGRTISPDLEKLIMQCLEKDPVKRPQSARDLSHALLACRDAGTWSESDACNWWDDIGKKIHDRGEDDPDDSHPASVIIVEDEESVRRNLSIFLEDEGFIVHATADAEVALEIISTQKIQMGIIDLRLPKMDGNTFILKAHELQPDMKFVIHTGSMDYALPRRLVNIGIQPKQVFIKPLLDMNLLVRAIKELTGRQGIQT